jgi:hypothetical protein
MFNLGPSSSAAKNIDEFGGAPFYIHSGSVCYRGE